MIKRSAVINVINEAPIKAKFYILFFALVSMFAFIVAKDVSLPHAVTVPAAALGLIVVLIGGFRNPSFILLALVAYLPFSKILVGQFGSEMVGLNLSNIFLLLVILAWIASSLKSGQRFLEKGSLNGVIVLFCLWGLFSLVRAKFLYGNNYNMEDYFILFKRWVTPILLYFIALNMVKDKNTLKKVVFVMMVATFLIGLLAIRDYINASDSSSSLEDSRVGGVFQQANMLGAFFVYNMFTFFGFFLYYYRSFKYWLLLIPFAVCFRGIMVTFSRGAYLAFAFGGLMMTFFKSKALFIVASLLLIVVMLNPVFLPEGIQYRLASTFGGSTVISTNTEDITDTSAAVRMKIWVGAVEMIKDQPLFGFGYGVFPYIIGSYVSGIDEMDAHNTYLILAAEMGIPALLIFLLILLMLTKNAWWLLRCVEDRYIKAFALGVLGGLSGLLVANMFGSRLNSEEVSSYFWIYAGLIMAAVRMKQKGAIV